MFFQNGPAVEKELRLVEVLGQVSYHGITPDLDLLVPYGFRADGGHIVSEPTRINPGFILKQSSEETVLCLQGATMFNGEELAYAGLRHDPAGPGKRFNKALYDAASSLYGYVDSQGGWKSRVWICGHSYGGAVGIVLAYMIRQARYDASSIRVMTLGSPRPCTLRGWDFIRGCNVTRFMAEHDVVPLVLPWASESPRLHSLLTAAASRRLDQYTQGGLGMVLYDDGSRSRSPYPPASPNDAGYDMVAWLTESMRAASSTHGWAKYRTLFLQRLSNATPAATASETSPANDNPPMPHGRGSDDDSRIAQARREFVVLGHDQTRSRRTLATDALLWKRKSLGLWLVEWQGRTVAAFNRRSDASKMVSLGNGFLKRMQRATDVQGEKLGNSLVDFLEDVLTDNGPANPAYRITGIPQIVGRS